MTSHTQSAYFLKVFYVMAEIFILIELRTSSEVGPYVETFSSWERVSHSWNVGVSLSRIAPPTCLLPTVPMECAGEPVLLRFSPSLPS